ncbi:MAG: glycosyltransferase family 2 protein [Crenarchaeota archaeon]|nr:glycosyltransferase family 2 protein [Thermoproteota archaeon]
MRKVAILWLNYNSMKFIDIIYRSLQSLHELDYDNYTIYIIDNGSTDGSFEKILDFVRSRQGLSSRCRIVRMSRNLGFAGAMNLVWRVYICCGEYSYVLFMNNDAVAFPESVRHMVEYCEQIPRLCGLQGIMEHGDSGLIYNYGVYIDETLNVIHFLRGRPLSCAPKHSIYVTYVQGAYALYNVNVLRRISLRNGDIFPRFVFGYWDDDLIGLRAWSMGYRMVAVPVLSCKHFESLTFKGGVRLADYITSRNYIAKILTYRTPYKPILLLAAFKYCLRRFLRGLRSRGGLNPLLIVRSLYDGLVLYRKVMREYGMRIDLSRVPIVRYGARKVLKYVLMYKTALHEWEKIEKELLERYRVD